MIERGLRIGEVSRAAGVSAGTIRYYERLGLLNRPERTESDYRVYSEQEIARLVFIRKAKLFGLTLEEIGQLLEIRSQGVPPCEQLENMIQRHLGDLDDRIQEMISFRKELASRYEQSKSISVGCESGICGIIERQTLPEEQTP